MPVELPREKGDEHEPSPPNVVNWLALLVITIVVGAVYTLTTWPPGDPANTARFWIQLFGWPFLAWAGSFGLRTLYWEQECARIEAGNTARQEDRREGIKFAGEPLAVLGYSYLTGAGTNGVSTLLCNKYGNGSSTKDSGGERSQYDSLGLAGDDEDPTRYRACFKELTSSIARAIRLLPSEIPLSIRLQLPENVNRDALLEAWRGIWSSAKLRPAIISLVFPERGVMELDEWLDIRGGPTLERCTLYVSARLREGPTGQGAEAATAILLGWAPLARRHGIRPIALLHRPVESPPQDFESAIARALLWGEASLDRVEDVWLSGIGGREKVAIAKYIEPQAATRRKGGDVEAIRDISSFLGDVGEVSAWLAIALGIENALHAKCPQLVASREGTLRFSVVQQDENEQDHAGTEA
ncbi:hypothetical protein AB4Y42_07895 [Paraburkholderia sp. EG286B]|uniref:hypothetical protein n=1 Tax=Paraburkholderia sp. EG286B TaxID=3237011 RepID=UPI0034D2EEBC